MEYLSVWNIKIYYNAITNCGVSTVTPNNKYTTRSKEVTQKQSHRCVELDKWGEKGQERLKDSL